MKIASDDRVALIHLARSHLLMCHHDYEVAVQKGRTVVAMLASAAHVTNMLLAWPWPSMFVCVRAMMAMNFERQCTPNAGLGIGCPCLFVC